MVRSQRGQLGLPPPEPASLGEIERPHEFRENRYPGYLDAMRLSEIFERFVDRDVPVGFRAYDGSDAGPADAETRR